VVSTGCGHRLRCELLSVDGCRLHAPYMHTSICGWQWPRIEYRVVLVSVEIYKIGGEKYERERREQKQKKREMKR
jgi:hypothetical protein